MTILLFIIVLLVTVLVHEWGHFIAARKSGMKVEEFGFGIPPKLWSWKKGETEYSINALPFGGFVKIAGENGLEETAPYERQFESKPWYKQSVVLIAGVVCNILLAIVLFTVSYTLGSPVLSETGTPTVIQVSKNGPIDQAGIEVGDTIISVSNGETTITEIDTTKLKALINNSTKPLTISYVHNKTSSSVTVTPIQKDSGAIIGVSVEKIRLEHSSFFQALKRGFQQTFKTAGEIFHVVGQLLTRLITGQKQDQSLIGPVGLAGEIKTASQIGFGYLLAFTAMISVNLAVINILPFPALDGGRLIIVLLERAFRRKFSKKVVGLIHGIGFLLLIGLMIVLSVGDIRRLL